MLRLCSAGTFSDAAPAQRRSQFGSSCSSVRCHPSSLLMFLFYKSLSSLAYIIQKSRTFVKGIPTRRRVSRPRSAHHERATPRDQVSQGILGTPDPRRRPEDWSRPSTPESPAGTTDYSPPFQRWVSRANRSKAPEGRKKAAVKPRASFVPGGTLLSLGPVPSDKSRGYGLGSQNAELRVWGPSFALRACAVPPGSLT